MALMLALAMAPKDENCCSQMAELIADPNFAMLHDLPEPLQFTPKYGKMGTAGELKAFLVPPKETVSSAVIMIHEWWGLNDYIKREAEKLHEETGFGVVAVDLFGGKVATNRDEAQAYVQSVVREDAERGLSSVVSALKMQKLLGRDMDKLGTLGWCFGGSWSLQTAILGGDDVEACVVYYGQPEHKGEKLAKLKAPVLGIFGTLDTGIPPAAVSRFKEVMSANGKSLEVHSYAAVHAFANPSNPRYDKDAANKAWSVTLDFLKKHLAAD